VIIFCASMVLVLPRAYFVRREGKRYDSKAIVGAFECSVGMAARASALAPSFERCTVLTSVSERYTCYEALPGGFFKISHAATARTSFRDKGPLT
jgi:hypothetical protein